MTAGHQPEHGTLDPSRVYNDYHDRVLAYLLGKNVSHEDAEDLCHTVFEKVFRALPDYDAEKASLMTWIYRITYNTLIDHYRTRREGIPLPDDIPSESDIESELITEETLGRLTSALSELEPMERSIIVMRYYNGMTLTDISHKTGINYNMVRALHKKALAILRRRLT